jgi:hypothetical protein
VATVQEADLLPDAVARATCQRARVAVDPAADEVTERVAREGVYSEQDGIYCHDDRAYAQVQSIVPEQRPNSVIR